MIKSNLTLSEAIAQFDRSPTNPVAEGYRSQRAEILARFPRDQWPGMRLEEYALGQPGVEDTYCYWLEYKCQWVGSIRGGSARKLIIYKRRDREGWYFPNMFSDEGEAWDRLRSEFVQAFELAGRGDWERIDELETLSLGPAVKLKSLHVHFPDEVLPVYSTAHLRRFLRLLDCPSEEVNAPSVVALNRFLLAALRREPALAGWNTEELQRLLYNWRDPRGTKRVLKIAPGEKARFWDECLREGYICVGWDEVGDLSQFESKEAFRARFEEAYPYNGLLAQARRKGNELWKLSELEPGDLVVANRGIGRVLAVGEVVQPGYRWADERSEYRHTVAVKWDTAYEQNVAPQKRWATVTVATVADTLLKTILGKERDPIVVDAVDAVYSGIAAALERKGQLILYGPPGTGKTYQARRFAVWWLLRQIGREGAAAVLGDSDRLREAERELSTSQVVDSGTTAAVGWSTVSRWTRSRSSRPGFERRSCRCSRSTATTTTRCWRSSSAVNWSMPMPARWMRRRSTTPSNWLRRWHGSSVRAGFRQDDRSGECAAPWSLARVDERGLPRHHAQAGGPRGCREVVGFGRRPRADRGAAAGAARSDAVVGGRRAPADGRDSDRAEGDR